MTDHDTCGIEVSKDVLLVRLRRRGKLLPRREFRNTPAGRRQLVRWLRGRERSVRAVLESTGTYGRDLAIALAEAAGIEVMVANPRSVRQFAGAQSRRSKTDAVDVDVLLDYAEAMEFVAWAPPSRARLALLGISRRLGDVARDRARERNRLHAAEQTATSAVVVLREIRRRIAALTREQERLLAAAEALIASDAELRRQAGRLRSMRGCGPITTVRLLGELGVLPERLRPRQWVALAGLDPVIHESGTSVRRPGRISRQGNRRIREILFYPALTIGRLDPRARAFRERLIARGKTPRQASVAVMRKLLHGIHAVLTHDRDWDSARLFPLPEDPPSAPAAS